MKSAVERRILGSGGRLPEKIETEPILGLAENPERFKEIERYPRLVFGENRVRCHPITGAIYLSSWRTKSPTGISGGETVIFQRGKKPAQEVNLRWSGYSDINSAIRGIGHVLEKYDKESGIAVQKTRRVIKGLSGILLRFRRGEINKDNIDEVSEEAIGILSETGFVGAKKPIKQDITKRFMLGAKEDSKGRVNPLVSRSRLLATWVRLTRELLFAGDVREKYLSILILLEGERDYERLRLEQANGILGRIIETPISSRQFEKEVAILKGFVRKHLIPASIKVAPYRCLALTALATLFGVRTEKGKQLIREMFKENPGKAEELIAKTPIDVVLKTGSNRDLAVRQIKERVAVAQELINLALAD